MTWPEAQRALTTGLEVRRMTWAPHVCLSHDGKKMFLRTMRGRKSTPAKKTYQPSGEAIAATDWVVWR